MWTRVNAIRRSRPLGGHLLRSRSYQYSPDLRIVFFVKEFLEEGDDSEIAVENVAAWDLVGCAAVLAWKNLSSSRRLAQALDVQNLTNS